VHWLLRKSKVTAARWRCNVTQELRTSLYSGAVLGGARKWLKFCGAAWHKVIGLVWHGSHLTSTVSLYRTAPQSAKNFHAPPSTSADHEFMLQSRDQMLESSGTALARMYHNFVQITAIRFNKVRTKEPNSIWCPLPTTLDWNAYFSGVAKLPSQ